MKTNKRFVSMLALMLFSIAFNLSAQKDSCWTLLLLQKGHALQMRTDMAVPAPNGFYLYRNCIYNISLTDKKRCQGRLINIKKDTLFFSNAFNEAAAKTMGLQLDTTAVPVSALDKLYLIADRPLGLYNKRSFSDYDFIFRRDTSHGALPSRWVKMYANDDRLYEAVPYLTAQGLNLLYEDQGMTYYFQGTALEKPQEAPADTTYDVRNFIWFTPNEVERINGLAIGFMAENTKNYGRAEKDSLLINGLNIEINPFVLFLLPYGVISGPYPDSIAFYTHVIKDKYELRINGVNMSLFGTINEARINGLNVAGALTIVDDLNGVSVSGLNNFSYVMNGVTIAALRNRAMHAKGFQLALYNKATDLRGIQVGLWNKNGRRSLPIVNWQFRPAKQHA